MMTVRLEEMSLAPVEATENLKNVAAKRPKIYTGKYLLKIPLMLS
tara:strand:+ start:1205 stop:1339 length:135 start_codon:yes stop_codon:yes gene_type:complete